MLKGSLKLQVLTTLIVLLFFLTKDCSSVQIPKLPHLAFSENMTMFRAPDKVILKKILFSAKPYVVILY